MEGGAQGPSIAFLSPIAAQFMGLSWQHWSRQWLRLTAVSWQSFSAYISIMWATRVSCTYNFMFSSNCMENDKKKFQDIFIHPNIKKSFQYVINNNNKKNHFTFLFFCTPKSLKSSIFTKSMFQFFVSLSTVALFLFYFFILSFF